MSADPRRALFAACRQLGMDEDDRRAVTLAITGKSSSKDLTPRDWTQLLDHLNKLSGYSKSGPSRWYAGCEALGSKVAALMASQKLPWRYLTHAAKGFDGKTKPSMLKRLAGVDRLEFAQADGLRAVIAALNARAKKTSPRPQAGEGPGERAGERD
jgi:phage gp16-like protein